MGLACSTPALPESPKHRAPQCSRAQPATPPKVRVSAAPVEAVDDGALERAEAAERAQFELGVRRDLWARAREGVGPSLPALGGLWHAERPQRKGGAAVELVRLVRTRAGLWSAMTVGGAPLPAGDVSWQCDVRAKEVTSFGLPGYTAFAQLRGSADGADPVFERCVLVTTTAPDALYLYRDRKCCLRCWRREPEAAAAVDPVPAAPVRPRGAPAAPATATAAAGATRTSKRRRDPAEAAEEEAEAERRAARAVAQWARGRDFTAMLRGLSDFPQLVSAAPAAPTSGDAKQIRRSYHAACKQLHPDRHVASGAAQQALASELFKVLSAAYVEAFHGQRV